MTLDEILIRGRRIWQDRMAPDQIVIRLTAVVGDLSKIVRTAEETGVFDADEFGTELGNVITTARRALNDVAQPCDDRINDAFDRQQRYADRLRT